MEEEGRGHEGQKRGWINRIWKRGNTEDIEGKEGEERRKDGEREDKVRRIKEEEEGGRESKGEERE